MLVAELARGRALTRPAGAVLAVLVAAAVLANAGTMRDAGRYLRQQGEIERADLAALELARNDIPARYLARGFPGYPFIYLRAGPYFDATAAYGSPALSPAELASASEPARLVADAELIRIHDVALREPPADPLPGPAPSPTSVRGGDVTEARRCVSFRPDPVRADGAPRGLELSVPPTGLLVEASGGTARVEIRRFADGFSRPLADTLGPSSRGALRIPADDGSRRWQARVTPQERVSVCGLR
jgi:hypothetical protein